MSGLLLIEDDATCQYSIYNRTFDIWYTGPGANYVYAINAAGGGFTSVDGVKFSPDFGYWYDLPSFSFLFYLLSLTLSLSLSHIHTHTLSLSLLPTQFRFENEPTPFNGLEQIGWSGDKDWNEAAFTPGCGQDVAFGQPQCVLDWANTNDDYMFFTRRVGSKVQVATMHDTHCTHTHPRYPHTHQTRTWLPLLSSTDFP